MSDYSGDIFVEGHELRSICREHYRKKYVSVLFQSSLLFDGTIEENLFFDKKGREAKLYRLVETLGFGDIWGEKGMKYIINEKNSNLSGGERQKILLLRTLQKECDLLILDEPTSWLDNISCRKLCEQLKREKKNRITIFITHDKILEEIADYIIQF